MVSWTLVASCLVVALVVIAEAKPKHGKNAANNAVHSNANGAGHKNKNKNKNKKNNGGGNGGSQNLPFVQQGFAVPQIMPAYNPCMVPDEKFYERITDEAAKARINESWAKYGNDGNCTEQKEVMKDVFMGMFITKLQNMAQNSTTDGAKNVIGDLVKLLEDVKNLAPEAEEELKNLKKEFMGALSGFGDFGGDHHSFNHFGQGGSHFGSFGGSQGGPFGGPQGGSFGGVHGGSFGGPQGGPIGGPQIQILGGPQGGSFGGPQGGSLGGPQGGSFGGPQVLPAVDFKPLVAAPPQA